MFYILHNSDNFTIIDCSYKSDEQKDILFDNIYTLSKGKGVTRFLSTHPDEDHIHGIEFLDKKIGIKNFYVVENSATKDNKTDSFKKYCELRDDKKKAYYVKKGCIRKWMNKSSDKNDKEQRDCAGINYLWPDTDNKDFKEALIKAKNGVEFNNISPIFTYSVKDNVKAMWMGDMETSFLEKIKDEIDWPKIDILFAPHHGRKSGHICSDVLDSLSPKIIVIGEAPYKDLDYYSDYNTIKQNSSGDITFVIGNEYIDIFVENFDYNYTIDTLIDNNKADLDDAKYIGSFKPYNAK